MRAIRETVTVAEVGSDHIATYAMLPEVESQPEVVWGRKNIEPIPLGSITVLSQVRDGDNPELANLIESIEKNDLINQIDLARMDKAALEEYIGFVNQLWITDHKKDDHKIEDCPVGPDGMYYLCIAGHSRIAALREIAARHPDARHIIDCKIHDTPGPAEIMALQLDENIHSKPSEERQAMAIVETFKYGKEKGFWDSREAFYEINRDKFSNRALINAMQYAKLPERIRAYPETYRVKVELGKMVNPLRLYYSKGIIGNVKSYENLSDEEHKQLIDQAVDDWLTVAAAHIRENKMSNQRAKDYLAGWSKHYRELNAARAKGQVIDFQLDGPELELEKLIRSKETELERSLRNLARGPINELMRITSKYGEVIENHEAVIEEIGGNIIVEAQAVMLGRAVGEYISPKKEESLW